MNIIELKDISKSFSGRKVLNQINLSIKKGRYRRSYWKKWFRKNSINEMYLWLSNP